MEGCISRTPVIEPHQPRGSKSGEAAHRANKQAKLLDLLRHPAGATVAAVSKASGWQQHLNAPTGTVYDCKLAPTFGFICSVHELDANKGDKHRMPFRAAGCFQSLFESGINPWEL
jgi:hypothetical protein